MLSPPPLTSSEKTPVTTPMTPWPRKKARVTVSEKFGNAKAPTIAPDSSVNTPKTTRPNCEEWPCVKVTTPAVASAITARRIGTIQYRSCLAPSNGMLGTVNVSSLAGSPLQLTRSCGRCRPGSGCPGWDRQGGRRTTERAILGSHHAPLLRVKPDRNMMDIKQLTLSCLLSASTPAHRGAPPP